MVANLDAYLPQLQKMHDARVAQSPAWKLMLDELTQYRTMRAKTSISLNFAAREAERKQQDAIQADFRARHKAIDGTDAALDDEQSRSTTASTPNERSLKSELKQEKEAKKAKDVQLNETAHILFDAIGLIKADPKLASEVLPYGGKFGRLADVAACRCTATRRRQNRCPPDALTACRPKRQMAARRALPFSCPAVAPASGDCGRVSRKTD